MAHDLVTSGFLGCPVPSSAAPTMAVTVHLPDDLARAAAARALADEFRRLRRGQTLRGTRVRDLIDEGRR